MIIILWQLGKKECNEESQEGEEEDPYEGMDYEEHTELVVNNKRTQRELMEWRIWNQFVKYDKEVEQAEDDAIDRENEKRV